MASIALTAKEVGKEYVIEHAFEEQKKWTLEYISSPKYRERVKRALARGFFQKESLTKEETSILQTQKLEQLYPTNINVSNVSENLVDEIIQKRLSEVRNAKMGIVDVDPLLFFEGLYISPGGQKDLIDDPYLNNPYINSANLKHELEQGKNILLARTAPELTPVHELSHASTPSNNDLGQKFQDIAGKRIQIQDANFTSPTEIKARLDSLRFELEKSGIYNPKSEDFNRSHIEKIIKDKTLKNSRAFRDLLKYVDKDNGDDLIWYMNNIADIGNIGSISQAELTTFLGRDIKAEDLTIADA